MAGAGPRSGAWTGNGTIPFAARSALTDRGGSVLSGRFRIHPAGKLLFAAFALVIVYSLLFLSARSVETLAYLVFFAAAGSSVCAFVGTMCW